MRHFKIMGLCLVAAFALAAIGSASASAETLPEVMQCVKAPKEKSPGKNYEGHYTGKKCEASTYSATFTTKTKYALEPWNAAGKGGASKVKEFKGSSGTAFLEVRHLGPITCKKGSDTGYFTGAKTVGKINVTFTGCELTKFSCSNTTKAGEIKTNTLKGEIGYVSEVFGAPVEHTTVGIKLTPESGEFEAENILCSTIKLRVFGSVIGEVLPPYNVFTKEVKLRFQQSAGKQAIQSFEGVSPVACPSEIEPPFAVKASILCTQTWTGTEWNQGAESAQSGEAKNKGEELELKA